MTERSDLLRAELAELDATAAFVAVKQKEKRGSRKWVEASDAMHTARAAYRALRDQEGAD